MTRPAHVDILGIRWRLLWRKPPKSYAADGLTFCDKRLIQIDPSLPPARMVEVISHEIDHATTESMDEMRARAASEAVAFIVRKIGIT